MQPPPFYSEFRLDRREYTCICMCACILAMHTCPCACIPRICIDSFLSPPRIRNGLSPLRRLTVSLHPSRLRLPRQLIFLSSSSLPILLSLSLSQRTAIRGCIESHRCTCTRCTSSYTCWTNSPLGHPSDEPSRKRGETRTHT